MKKVLAIAAIVGLFGCSDDSSGDISGVSGTIGGEAWEFRYANAFYEELDELYDVEFYSTEETGADPCSIFISTKNHFTVRLPTEVGNYNLPLSPESRSVRFEPENLVATSGFIEVTAINGTFVTGFLQATFDDDNTVSGAFSFDTCF